MRAIRLAVLLLAASVSAQNTWIVDRRGGPGLFPDLAPAVAAAAPGDTILVVITWTTPLTSWYHGTVIDKPLKIIGVSEPGLPLDPGRAAFQDKITVRNIPAGSEVLLAYLYLVARNDTNPPYLPIPHGLVVENCAGKVHIEDVGYDPWVTGSGEVRFENCPDLSMHWCDLELGGRPILVRSCNAALTECRMNPVYPLAGAEPFNVDRTSSTLRLENSTVRLVDSVVVGANTWQTLYNGLQPARSPIDLLNSTLQLATNAMLYGGLNNGLPVNAVIGTGTVIEDPYSSHTGIQSGITILQQRIPVVYMERVIRNQPFHTMVVGPPNGFSLLAIGFPLRHGIAFPFGTLMLDPMAMGVLGLGPLDHLGSLQQQWRVPANAPMDLLFALQAATLGPNGALGLTCSSVFSIAWEGGRTWP